MKQVNFVLECIITEDDTTFIIRDAGTGRVFKIVKTCDDISSYLVEVILPIQNSFNSDSHEK